MNLEREGQPVQMRQQSPESRPQPFPTFLPGQNLPMEPTLVLGSECKMEWDSAAEALSSTRSREFRRRTGSLVD